MTAPPRGKRGGVNSGFMGDIRHMVSKRQSRLEGHRRKFMAVIDNTPECGRAVRYAAMRAKNSGEIGRAHV